MAEPVQTSASTLPAQTGPGSATAGQVASGSAPGKPPTAPPGGSALASVADYGGNRGGRPRSDNLVPGSAKAKEADRKKEAERKAEYRARQRAENPKTIPVVLPRGESVPNQATAPAGDQVAGLADSFVSWVPEDVTPVLEEIVPFVEQQRVAKKLAKGKDAGLSADLLKEIEKSARWNDVAKTRLVKSGSTLSAKWLNKAGISAEWKDETTFALALLLIVQSDRRTEDRLDKLIEQRKELLAQSNQQKP